MGTRPQPTALRVLRGNPGKRPYNGDEAAPEAADLEPPAYLNGAALEEWQRIAPILHRLGLMTEIDAGALATYCQTFARWREAEDKIAADGMVTVDRFGFPHLSPYVSIAQKSVTQLKALLCEFGMTPSARSRVRASADRDRPSDPFAEFDARRPRRPGPEDHDGDPSD